MARKIETTCSFDKHKVNDMLPIQRERRGFEDGENMSGPAIISDSSLSAKVEASFDTIDSSSVENRDRDGPGAIPRLLSENRDTELT